VPIGLDSDRGLRRRFERFLGLVGDREDFARHTRVIVYVTPEEAVVNVLDGFPGASVVADRDRRLTHSDPWR
jgi:hypothetical protein